MLGLKGTAAAKIVRVLSDPDVQRSLRNYLGSRRDLFSTEQFMRRTQELVRDFGEAPLG